MKPRNFFCIFSVFFLFIINGNTAVAGNTEGKQDLGQALKQSEAYLKQQLAQQLSKNDYDNVKIATKPFDPRLAFTQCDKPLTFSHQQSGSIKRSISVKVQCIGAHQWAFYAKHTVALEKSVLSIAKGLPRHHVIQEQDLSYTVRDVYKLRTGYLSHKAEVLGQQLKRSLKTGDLIYQYVLKAPDIIKKGDAISIVASHGGLSVVTPGIAMNNGRKGEQIRVENRRSSRIIRAQVIGPNRVQVIL